MIKYFAKYFRLNKLLTLYTDWFVGNYVNQTALWNHKYYLCKLSKESNTAGNDELYNINENDFCSTMNLNDLLSQGSGRDFCQFCTACSSSGLANVSYEIKKANRSKVFHCYMRLF